MSVQKRLEQNFSAMVVFWDETVMCWHPPAGHPCSVAGKERPRHFHVTSGGGARAISEKTENLMGLDCSYCGM
jgi:hypothetical protein